MMALLGHMFMMLIGFAAASFAAAAIMSVGIAAPFWATAALSGYEGQGLWIATWVTSFIVAGFAFLPAFLVMLIAESFRLRSILFYALAGAAIGLMYSPLGAGIAQWWIEFNDQVISRRPIELIVAAGIGGGIVYWAIVGRNAGKWREYPVSRSP
jgi:hypothetical protein